MLFSGIRLKVESQLFTWTRAKLYVTCYMIGPDLCMSECPQYCVCVFWMVKPSVEPVWFVS